ncbi:MAG: hypothetical protein F6K17_18170 [Okeania sp. SIO3C4]|nr:hypothetical protein [Okeania sp. SIO3C4]
MGRATLPGNGDRVFGGLLKSPLYHVRLNTYTLEEGRQKAAGAEGRRKRKV